MNFVGSLFVLATALVAPAIGGGWHGNGQNGQGGAPQPKPDCAENAIPNQPPQNNFNNRAIQPPANNQAQQLSAYQNGNGNNKQFRQFEGQQLNAIPQSFQKPQFRHNNQPPAHFNQQAMNGNQQQPRPNQNNAPPLSPCEQYKLQQNRQQGLQGSGKPFTEFFNNGNGQNQRGNGQQGFNGNQQQGFNGNQQQQRFNGNQQQQGNNGNGYGNGNGNGNGNSNGNGNGNGNGFRNGNNGQQGLSQQPQGFNQQQFANNGQRFNNFNQNGGQQPLQNNPCPQG